MANKKPEITIFPTEIDWNDFTADELEQIEFAVELMRSYVKGRKSRPEPFYVKNMFLDEFDGFEDATPELAVAITEKPCEIREAEDDDATPKKTDREKYIEHEMLAFEGYSDEIKEEGLAAVEKLAPYVGFVYGHGWVLKDDKDEETLKTYIDYDRVHSKIDVDAYVTQAEYAESVEDKVNVVLRKFVRSFEKRIYRPVIVNDYVDAIRNEEGLGTPVYSAVNALRKVLETAGITQFAVQCTPMDFVPGSPVSAVVSVAWVEDGEFHIKNIYGHGQTPEEDED